MDADKIEAQKAQVKDFINRLPDNLKADLEKLANEVEEKFPAQIEKAKQGELTEARRLRMNADKALNNSEVATKSVKALIASKYDSMTRLPLALDEIAMSLSGIYSQALANLGRKTTPLL